MTPLPYLGLYWNTLGRRTLDHVSCHKALFLVVLDEQFLFRTFLTYPRVLYRFLFVNFYPFALT
jgi:hypothetical protein